MQAGRFLIYRFGKCGGNRNVYVHSAVFDQNLTFIYSSHTVFPVCFYVPEILGSFCESAIVTAAAIYIFQYCFFAEIAGITDSFTLRFVWV